MNTSEGYNESTGPIDAVNILPLAMASVTFANESLMDPRKQVKYVYKTYQMAAETLKKLIEPFYWHDDSFQRQTMHKTSGSILLYNI